MTKQEIKEAVIEALNEQEHVCRFNISKEQADILSNHLGSISDLGHGDINIGLLEMQDNHRYTYHQRQWRDKIANKIGNVVIGAIGIGLIWALWEGFKNFVQGKGGG